MGYLAYTQISQNDPNSKNNSCCKSDTVYKASSTGTSVGHQKLVVTKRLFQPTNPPLKRKIQIDRVDHLCFSETTDMSRKVTLQHKRRHDRNTQQVETSNRQRQSRNFQQANTESVLVGKGDTIFATFDGTEFNQIQRARK